MWHVYMLLCEGGTIYTGIARDVRRRFQEHKRGTGARYTRSHKPVRILHTERHAGKGAALRREAEVKRLSKAKKRELAGL